MIKKALKYAVLPVLFCAAVSLIICTLHAKKEAQTRAYEEAYQSIPVTITAAWPTECNYYQTTDQKIEVPNTNKAKINGRVVEIPIMVTISGNEIDISNSIGDPAVPLWVLDLFTEQEPVKFYDVSGVEDSKELENSKKEVTHTELSLAEYVKDVQYTLLRRINSVNSERRNGTGMYYLSGISSLSCVHEFSPENDCEIKWYEGYDESIFEGEEPYCLIPEGKIDYYDSGNGEVVLGFELRYVSYEIVNGELVKNIDIVEHQFPFKIAGTYTGGDWKSVYCSVPAAEKVHTDMDVEFWYDSVSATLADNSRLEEFREKMSFCFPERAPGAEKVPWGYYANDEYHKTYPLSLDIDDEALLELTAAYEESLNHNRRVTQTVLVISAVAGFVIILLTICSIIRDINKQKLSKAIKED